MSSWVPSTDQVKSQLLTIVPAVAAILTAYGYAGEAGMVSTSLLVAGPLSILICSIWSLIDNTREAIMLKASKPVTPDAPKPQIVLPKQEAELADKLPSNVTSVK